MSTRIWLKADMESRLATLGEEEIPEYLKEIKICRISGKKYVDIHLDFLNPVTEIPDRFMSDIIEKVTVKEHRIYRGFRTDAVYFYDDAELVADTVSRVHLQGDEYGGNAKVEREEWQNISIVAPNVGVLRDIYSKFRRGLLRPVEDREANSRVVDSGKHMVYHMGLNEFEEEVPTTDTKLAWDTYHGIKKVRPAGQ